MTKKSNKLLILLFVSGMSVFFLLSPILNTDNGYKTDLNTNLHSGQVPSTSLRLWNYTWGGSGIDCGYHMASDSSGNAYVVGATNSFGAGNGDMVLVKFNSEGIKQWNYTWGGSGNEQGWGITLDTSGNTYVTGYTNSFGAGSSDIFLVKFSPEGIKQWNYTWGGSGNERGYGVALDSSGNLFVAGSTTSFGAGNYDIALVKFNSVGIKQWNYTWGGSGIEEAYQMALDSSGNAYVTGYTNSFGAGSSDIFLVKFSPEGIKQWNYTWGGSGDDFGHGMALDSSGNVYIAGKTTSFGASFFDMVLVKFNSVGIKQWNYTWGGSGVDFGYETALDSSGNAYVAGGTISFGECYSDMVLVKFSAEGIHQWNYTWGGSGNEQGYGVALDSSGNVYVAGTTNSFGAGGYDIFLVKFGSDTSEDSQPFPILIPIIIGVSVVGVLAVGVIYIYLRRK